MLKKLLPLLAAAALLVPAAASANGYTLAGHVYCELTGLPLPGITIQVTGSGFSGSGTTDAAGYYEVVLPFDGGTFTATAQVGPDETVIFPSGGAYLFTTSPNDPFLFKNWVIASPTCSKPEGMCWLTAGGAKFSQIIEGPVGEVGRRHNWGGNVYPGCSATAGDGGQWNHVDEALKRHFQGFHIHVERCGNVDGIPPGSESPVTPFNFIEFTGTGRVKGIKGNKENWDLVYFFARCEDRNEPGSNGQRDGLLKDRYFLHVYSDPNDRFGSTILLVDVDGNPATVDPVTITDGNMQIHISSCDSPPAARNTNPNVEAMRQTARPVSNEFWFATSPNPVVDFARIRFGLPSEGRVTMRVFDVSGRFINNIVDANMTAGEHDAGWNLLDVSGRRVGRGMYFIQMQSRGLSRVSRIVVP